jgi:polyphosphate kinase 2 (PPK2 family)
MPRTAARALTSSFAGKQPRKRPSKLERKKFEGAIEKLHVELVKLQLLVRHKGLKVVIIFEGRDTAGKGGIIKRITEGMATKSRPDITTTCPALIELRIACELELISHHAKTE